MTIKAWKDKIMADGFPLSDCIDYFTRACIWTDMAFDGHIFRIYEHLQDNGNGLQYGGKLTPKYIAEYGIEYIGIACLDADGFPTYNEEVA